MNIRFFLFLAAIGCLFTQCKKQDPIVPNNPEFVIRVNNEFNELEARYALYLSDSDGKVLAFRWIPGDDTARISIPNVASDVRYDCTLAKITTIDASGTGLRDTTISLTTYTKLASGETINLRDLEFRQLTDVLVHFTGVSSFDSIIVSDGLTFVRPQVSNGFTGQYSVLNTGKIWMRLKINGEDHWRFMLFENVGSEDIQATIDATLLPTILAHPKEIALPFVAPWTYNIEGVVNLDGLKFFPLGDLRRAPGGAVPIFNNLTVFEPITNDVFNPGGTPYSNFRVQMSGTNAPPNAYFYALDRIYTDLPTEMPIPTFDVASAPSANSRFSAASATGEFDVLSITRSYSGTPHLDWEVLVAPITNGIVSYRLPDLPAELANLSTQLKQYNFDGSAKVKGELYDQFQGYAPAISQQLRNDDPIWKAKAGYLAKGR